MFEYVAGVRSFHGLCNEKRLSEAIDVLGEIERQARLPADHAKLGYCYSRIGMFSEAEHSLGIAWHHATPFTPEAVQIACELASVKYHLGKFDEGAALEKRVHDRNWYQISSIIPESARDGFSLVFREKLISDADSVEGKRVFVIWSGGAGDVIEHLRHIECLAADGATTVFLDPKESLSKLIQNSALRVAIEPATLPNLASCDALILGNVLNLRYHGSELLKVPGTGYLRPVRQRRSSIVVSAPVGKRKVGIVWRSINGTWETCRHEPFRSMELATLEPLLVNSDIQFYSLQFGERGAEENATLARCNVIDASPYVHSFADLAEITLQLDLVITIDSAPAHLAGALDVPVWNLLANVCDHRWGAMDQRTTPLYPSMRLFRQPALGDWGPVITEVAAELRHAEHREKMVS
ncbi:hypothetical protein PTKU64_77260 [Paraburkholderia terrae]|uniref:ADP-heptose--LPS heptosyltransferase n=1 Tax=Paraburkholderia terrae TaxID=311230 RepID=A0ABM7TY88_9BURK|nr:glycosyltransferase family 9 protein [Paraburkholderia terrae]BCZ84051.1 hypothetical protein PTKU64_77260 [Paraburkholderia terrae]